MPTIDQWKGSRLRCILLSGLPVSTISQKITRLIESSNANDLKVKIREDDFIYYPRGYLTPNEIRLGDVSPLLDDNIRKKLIKWWLDIDKDTSRQTPNWDFACSALINNDPGLILIEAKAHQEELTKKDWCKAKSEKSKLAIKLAIERANEKLDNIQRGFALDTFSHYQISNRFAWSWKLASKGIPVVLIYLGFLETAEMKQKILKSHQDWVKIMHDYSEHLVPEQVWGNKLQTGKKAVYPLICSMNIQPQGKIESINGN